MPKIKSMDPPSSVFFSRSEPGRIFIFPGWEPPRKILNMEFFSQPGRFLGGREMKLFLPSSDFFSLDYGFPGCFRIGGNALAQSNFKKNSRCARPDTHQAKNELGRANLHLTGAQNYHIKKNRPKGGNFFWAFFARRAKNFGGDLSEKNLPCSAETKKNTG